MRGAEAFGAALKELDVRDICVEGQRVSFTVDVPVGTHAGEAWRVGLEVPPDFPDVPPSGPHVSPPLQHPQGAVHGSGFGPAWVYWSRPIANWSTAPTVRAYVRHVLSLFAQVA